MVINFKEFQLSYSYIIIVIFSYSGNSRNKTKTKVILNISVVLEMVIAAILAVLSVDPIGQLRIRSCRTQWLSDWYTVLYNPTPYYLEPLRCTQEAVYPLYVLIDI